ncbi:MAG: fatty acid desaturase [Verrucomicrobiota bacterium]
MPETIKLFDLQNREALIRGLFPQFILALAALGLIGGSYWMLLPTLMMFIVVPALDHFVGEHMLTIKQEKVHPKLQEVLSYSTLTYVVFFFVCLLWLIAVLDTLNWWETTVAIVSFACAGGVLAAAGHELIHRKQKTKVAFGQFAFNAFGYWHFPIAHIRNHHAHVATEKDNHAPSRDASYWKYLVESYPKSYAESCRIVDERIRKHQIQRFSLKNPYLSYFGIPVLMLGIAFSLGGIPGLLLYTAIALFSVLFSEAAFYLEHYGLKREESEKVAAHHSWDSYHRFSNYQTFMVQRHADHHLNAGNEYIYLRSHRDSYRLPLGYPLLSLLAFYPKGFHQLMNRELDRQDSRAPTPAA